MIAPVASAHAARQIRMRQPARKHRLGLVDAERFTVDGYGVPWTMSMSFMVRVPASR